MESYCGGGVQCTFCIEGVCLLTTFVILLCFCLCILLFENLNIIPWFHGSMLQLNLILYLMFKLCVCAPPTIMYCRFDQNWNSEIVTFSFSFVVFRVFDLKAGETLHKMHEHARKRWLCKTSKDHTTSEPLFDTGFKFAESKKSILFTVSCEWINAIFLFAVFSLFSQFYALINFA